MSTCGSTLSCSLFMSWNWFYGEGSMIQWGRAAKVHCKCLWHVIKWSLVRPAACINEWTTVGPTNLNPLLTMSLLMLSDFDVFTGILWPNLYWVEIGLWFTNPQMYLSNEPKSFITCNAPISKENISKSLMFNAWSVKIKRNHPMICPTIEKFFLYFS